MTLQAPQIVIGGIVLKRLVRIVTRNTSNPRISVLTPAAAHLKSVRLKANSNHAEIAGWRKRDVEPSAMAGAAEIDQVDRAHCAWICNHFASAGMQLAWPMAGLAGNPGNSVLWIESFSR